ncbi:hypothetical protein [Spirillospora albida]|uniref:hypothetical protein n=1 Tax=Spirillospora albida TaxID=58123 RepID=UPI000692081E|nr:hypothetical protein [Spirillospora albida]
MWDDAHTDHTRTDDRPEPAGLAVSSAAWQSRLRDSPNGHLLARNTMTDRITSGRPLHLLHTTVALDAIRATGHLYASTGCLAAAIYCTPLTPEHGGLRPHNLGAHLLEHRPWAAPLVIEIAPDGPAPAEGIDYLRMGRIHLDTFLTHSSYLTAAEHHQLRTAAVTAIGRAAPFLDRAMANAAGHRTDPETFVDDLAAAVPTLPFLGYLYFEVLSEYLMLHSTTGQTKAYAAQGELHSRLTKDLAFAAVDGMATLFDLARFHPAHQQLTALIDRIDPALTRDVTTYTRDRLTHLLAVLSLDHHQDATACTFHHRDFDELARLAPSLLGQTIYRLTRPLPRYPDLYLALEQSKALAAWTHWNTRKISTPFAGFLPKGEIGINPSYPNATCTIWTAHVDHRGLLHPQEHLDVRPIPRLADLNLTAMRRDTTGRAAGHLAAQ